MGAVNIAAVAIIIPTHQHCCPATSVTTPIAVVYTPATAVTTPIAVVYTPATTVTTSITVVYTPATTVAPPITVVYTPATAVTTPIAVVYTIATAITTPIAAVYTPATAITTPIAVVYTPATAVTTPITVFYTPATAVTTPITAVYIAAVTIIIPIAAVYTPATAVTTPIAVVYTPATAVTTPITVFYTPATAVTTPIAAVYTPATAVTTPIAAVYTPATAVTTPIAVVYTPATAASTTSDHEHREDFEDSAKESLPADKQNCKGYVSLVNSGKMKKKTMWDTIGSKFQDMGYGFGSEQKCGRWKSLMRAYKNTKDSNKKSGSCRKTFEYEDQLDELFAKDPTIQPECTLSSNSTTVSKGSASDETDKDDDSSSSSTPEVPKKKASRSNASELDQMKRLDLTLKQGYVSLVNSGKMKKKTMWDTIGSKFQDMGYGFGSEQKCGRWKSLMRAYKNTKDSNKKSGSCRKTFEYEDQLDELFAKDPTIQPECTLSSNSTTVSKGSASDETDKDDDSSSSSTPEVPKKKASRSNASELNGKGEHHGTRTQKNASLQRAGSSAVPRGRVTPTGANKTSSNSAPRMMLTEGGEPMTRDEIADLVRDEVLSSREEQCVLSFCYSPLATCTVIFTYCPNPFEEASVVNEITGFTFGGFNFVTFSGTGYLSAKSFRFLSSIVLSMILSVKLARDPETGEPLASLNDKAAAMSSNLPAAVTGWLQLAWSATSGVGIEEDSSSLSSHVSRSSTVLRQRYLMMWKLCISWISQI
ncbi:hypothetical protein MAR_013883 [Mya arenaria]|uniref:Myb/SANT-like DNA-binding domain-containing protein n=1 Tax=Mya arenaria TaxID=6604 RepID=A0ABY7G472_MYAAR|nr:hypothetical protein MAR_013883 [Mya arenaria]